MTTFINNKIISSDLDEIYESNTAWEKLKGKTVLVSGAYGMLASYVMYMLIYLNEKKYMNIHIIALVRDVNKMNARFGEYALKSYMTVLTQPLDDKIRVDGSLDYIIHAASLASPNCYGVCPVDVMVPNTLGTYHLLNLAREKKVKSFLLFSSSGIYGVCDNQEMIRENSLGVMDTLDIHNCYGEGKRCAETLAKSFLVQYNVPIKIARIWHTYAPTMNIQDDPRVFSSFVKDIVSGKNIVMKSDGSAKRSFCYITDATIAYFKILIGGEDGEAYNVCNTREWHSIKELADILVSLKPELRLTVECIRRNANDSYMENTVANDIPPSNDKLKELVDWEPKVSCREGFKRVIKYYEDGEGK